MAEGQPPDPHQSRALFSGPLASAPPAKYSSTDAESHAPDRMFSAATVVSDPMLSALQEGASLAQLISVAPEEVITALRDHSVRELARFTVDESDVLLAFGDSFMLTRGSDSAKDENCEENWRALIASKVVAQQEKRKMMEGGWDQKVTVVAKVVAIKNAAAGQDRGLLYPLVQKSLCGAAGKEVWEFTAVEAVIEYKWRHWARRYLLWEFILYLGWVSCFSIFLLLYIENDINADGGARDAGADLGVAMVSAGVFDILSLLSMLPFLLIEVRTMVYYGRAWFMQVWNMLDFAAYALQLYITFAHLSTHKLLDSKSYNTILAVQCTLLYIKVQYFSRFFGTGAAFAQLIARVMKRVQGFLVFITLTTISAALSFAVLYREDLRQDETNELEEDFDGFLRSLVTVYAVLLGNFESDYVFGTTNKVLKGIFFLFFQVMMSITVLNILIAVMTESYTNIVEEERVMDNMGRAQVMDELEIAMPSLWSPNLKPYCHFLVVDTGPQPTEEVGTGVISPQSSLPADTAVHKEILDLKKSVQELKEMIQALRQ